MDSSESPTYGEQEGSAYNGHFGRTCYHPLFVFNQLGDLERCALRSGNVHSADGWRMVLEPVVARYRGTGKRCYFRGDAAFANPEIYEFLEAEGYCYVIRLPTNNVLQGKIGYLLSRPVGRPPHEVRRHYASFSYRAQSWKKPRRGVAKVEWHPGELYPRVGFIVTNLSRPAERIVAFYNQRGTCEQWIKEGKGAIKWTRLSCRSFAANGRPPSAPRARLQPRQLYAHAGDAEGSGAVVADQPAREADQDRCQGRQPWPLCHVPDGRGRGVAADVRGNPVVDRPAAGAACTGMKGIQGRKAQITMGEVRHGSRQIDDSAVARPSYSAFWLPKGRLRPNCVAAGANDMENHADGPGIRGISDWIETGSSVLQGSMVRTEKPASPSPVSTAVASSPHYRTAHDDRKGFWK
jgi:hypothetical protein